MVYATDSINLQDVPDVLSAHDIFWVKRNGSRVLVCRAGDLLSFARLDRFPKLERELQVNQARIETISKLLLELKNSNRPKEKMLAVSKIRTAWSESFNSSDKLSILELIILSDRVMGQKLTQHAQTWAKASLPLFHRSCFVAMMALIGASALGYSSWSYLENLWQISFSHSAAYALSGMAQMTLPCLESLRHGSGVSQPQLAAVLSGQYPSLDRVAHLSFEKADGQGWPRALNLMEMNDIERWFAHIQGQTPWDQDIAHQDQSWFLDFWKTDSYAVIHKMTDQYELDRLQKASGEYLDFGL